MATFRGASLKRLKNMLDSRETGSIWDRESGSWGPRDELEKKQRGKE